MSDNVSMEQIYKAADDVSARLKADVILFNNPISDEVAVRFHSLLESIPQKNETVFLILATYGGDAHAAYLIARDLQNRYKKVIVCIAGDCYSAGTLVVLCAHEVVITDRGKLGPLDVQLIKKDELRERLSGLTVNIALEELQKQTLNTFIYLVVGLKGRFGPELTFKTAMEVASNLTGGVYSEIYKQIDPVRIGDDARALQIAAHYGERLGKTSNNLKNDAVQKLLTGYPAHECIIDRNEAETLFQNLRPPTDEETKALRLLEGLATDAMFGQFRVCLSVLSGRIMQGDDSDGDRTSGEELDEDTEQCETNNKHGGSSLSEGGYEESRQADSASEE